MARVRPACPADAPVVRALQSHLREPSPQLLTHGLHAGEVLVAVVDDEPVGYVLPVTGRETHVAELAVAPAHRRAGHATRLLRRVIRDATGRVTLFVHPDNESARALYGSLGFRRIGRRPSVYEDRDAIVMAHE